MSVSPPPKPSLPRGFLESICKKNLTESEIYSIFSGRRYFIYYYDAESNFHGENFNPSRIGPYYAYKFETGETLEMGKVRMCELKDEAVPLIKQGSASASPSDGPSNSPSNVPAAVPVTPSADQTWRDTMKDPRTGKDLRSSATYPYEIDSKDAIDGEFYVSGFSEWGQARWVDGVLHLVRHRYNPDVIVDTPRTLWSIHPPPSAGGSRRTKKSRKQRKQKRRTTRK